MLVETCSMTQCSVAWRGVVWYGEILSSFNEGCVAHKTKVRGFFHIATLLYMFRLYNHLQVEIYLLEITLLTTDLLF
jgi:hypothetical protein